MIGINKNKILIPTLHVGAWSVIFFMHFVVLNKVWEDGLKVDYVDFFISPLSLLFIFYINYLLFVPKFLFDKKNVFFILVNLLMVGMLLYVNYEVHENFRRENFRQEEPPIEPYHSIKQNKPNNGNVAKIEIEEPHKMHKHMHGPHFGMLHDFLNMLLVICISVMFKYTIKWFAAEDERRELEKSKMEMELKNLKSQLNPHFLFNTLNNIYALIGISQDKAQQAVIDLSKLLRYVLYDSEDSFVTLQKEVDFIQNYIKLMKLRLTSGVDVNVDINIDGHTDDPVIQLVFISLVENAFKHGVCINKKSFINIKLWIDEEKNICFEEKNSYFPKSKGSDKSGSGIGLENLQRRLDLTYPGKYEYKVEHDDNCYTAYLKLKS